ncbi:MULTISPECIES: hypothetical protein [unclassified Streptomyces]|uniref:hypothetical protein n=1 Tax=unclassified Streptomyces TaxID=2593676 RepID=UPI002E183CE9|nr:MULTISPECIES: hypothetical protein [unclassified Streptomyces]
MTDSHPRTSPKTSLPITLWLPGPEDLAALPIPPAVLPGWAIDKIRAEFTRSPGRPPTGLLRLTINDSAPGMDARIPCTTHAGDRDGDTAPGEPGPSPVILAELHPDSLPAPDAPLTGSAMPGSLDDGWPGFFHRAHRLLDGDGLLLVAARQRRDHDQLRDPLGLLIATARTAGFRYLQHIVVIHAHADGDHLVPTPPDPDIPDVVHSDLLVLDTARSRP